MSATIANERLEQLTLFIIAPLCVTSFRYLHINFNISLILETDFSSVSKVFSDEMVGKRGGSLRMIKNEFLGRWKLRLIQSRYLQFESDGLVLKISFSCLFSLSWSLSLSLSPPSFSLSLSFSLSRFSSSIQHGSACVDYFLCMCEYVY